MQEQKLTGSFIVATDYNFNLEGMDFEAEKLYPICEAYSDQIAPLGFGKVRQEGSVLICEALFDNGTESIQQMLNLMTPGVKVNLDLDDKTKGGYINRCELIMIGVFIGPNEDPNIAPLWKQAGQAILGGRPPEIIKPLVKGPQP